MTFKTRGASDLHRLIQRLVQMQASRDFAAAHGTLAAINVQLKMLDDALDAAGAIGQEAAIMHETITAIREGQILVANGSAPGLTLADLKDEGAGA